ncbi:MAG: hypothetical protein F6K65_41565, partial [Moorea sp. SIO3C2]|nr:hypothetical protein [Moorena sp. SIO3C2]
EEWGLGKAGTANSEPIALTNFVASYSMIDLMDILRRNLWQDYIRWEDIKIRSLWSPTASVIYNDNCEVVATAGEVNPSPDNDASGGMTEDFLYSIGYYMSSLQIPTLPDECYGIAIPIQHTRTIRKSLEDKLEASTKAELDEICNLLSAMTGGHVDRVTGYVGKIGNMHVWNSNALSRGAAGSPGVVAEISGAGLLNFREGFAFGDMTIGSGIGSPFEIRFDEVSDFNRSTRAIWHEERSFTPLDVDPTGYGDTAAVPQQLRVLRVRCSDNIF